MRNKLPISIRAIAITCFAFTHFNIYAQAVAPGSNVPATPPAAPPDVTTYPDMPTYINATKYNYIRTYVPDQPATSTTGTLYHRKVTDFFDGLGRPLQTVNERGHADGFDIVQTHVYDNMGRESYQYLPYATNIDQIYTNGNFHPNVHADVHNFFYVNQGEEPYSKTEYDNSPLNRVTKQLSPGHNWVGSSRGLTTQYGTNQPVIYTTGNPPVGQQMSGAYPHWTKANNIGSVPVATDVYADNTLYKTTTTDADGNETDEFRNKLGQVVWKRTLLNNVQPIYRVPSDYANTFYIYNDLGQLICVIPPAAVTVHAALISGVYTVTWSVASAALNMCFQYQYDTRGRLMARQEPDKAVEYYVYDKRDRMVCHQDGNLRTQTKWDFTFYDALDRPFATGVFSSGQTQSQLQTRINSTTTYPNTSVLYYFMNYSLWHTYPTEALISNTTFLTYTYYDDYADIPATGYGYSDQFTTVGQPYLVQPAKSNNTKGLVTQTKSRVLEAPVETWITAVNYYDDKGRLIQTVSDNIDGGLDTVSNAYYFQGMLWKTITRHNNPFARHVPGAEDELKNIVLEDTYDRNISTGGGNDLVWAHHQKLNDGINYELAYYDYNESGQVRNKQFTVTNVTNDYNITGWLTSIDASYHNTGDATQDKQFFHEDLYYDKGFASKLYNGNIAGITWSKYTTAGVFAPQNAYGYSYDMLNRLKQAEFRYQGASGGAWSKAVKDYTVSNIAYDLNGNLRSMDQRNPGSGSPIDMDKLSYTYTANSNKLVKVKDDVPAANTNGLPDFKDNTDVATEYTYDNNGNLITDGNKKITAVSYNYLNKPSQITVQGQGTINYYYDAAGNRLRKIVTPLTGDKDTFDYIGNFVYKNQVLQYVLNEEGRARPVYSSELDATKFVYDYFIKDHLGNVQSTLTARPAAALYLASCEIAAANIEQLLFDNIPAVREEKPGGSGDDTKAAELVATDSTRRIGPAIMFKAMPGDEINFGVKSYYDDNHTDPKNTVGGDQVIGSLLTTLMGGADYNGVPVEQVPGSVRTVQQTLGNTANVANGINQIPVTNQDDGAPRAYLNVLVFDAKTFQLIPGQSQRVQIPMGGSIWHDFAPVQLGGEFHPLTGSVLVIAYVNNESIGNNVWFDDLDISHYSGNVLEDNFYYPFGLTITDPTGDPSITKNNVLFQSQQHEDDFGINMYSFKWREHDPTIGRFWQIDPLASDYVYNSPYAFSENKVTSHRELEGLEVITINPAVGTGAGGGAVGTLGGAYMLYSMWSNRIDAIQANPYAYSNTAYGKALIKEREQAAAEMLANQIVEVAPTIYEGFKMLSDKVDETIRKIDDKVNEIKSGTIYKVPGNATKSGKPYIGRHNKPTPQKTRKSNDGRDRSKAEIIDEYNSKDTKEGQYKEQKAIDENGGVENLDNKRNEVNPDKMENLKKTYENGGS